MQVPAAMTDAYENRMTGRQVEGEVAIYVATFDWRPLKFRALQVLQRESGLRSNPATLNSTRSSSQLHILTPVRG